MKQTSALAELLQVMARLRSPEGCPWDREQDHRSLRFHAVEEVYELMDAIETGDDHEMLEELGDLLLQVVFHCQLARERGAFDFDKVCRHLVDKLIHRHPHVFGDAKAKTVEAVWTQWEKLKRAEKHGTKHARPSALDGIPNHLPALLRAEKLVKKARRAKLFMDDRTPNLRHTKSSLAKQLFTLAEFAQSRGWSAEELLRAETIRQERSLRGRERSRTVGPLVVEKHSTHFGSTNRFPPIASPHLIMTDPRYTKLARLLVEYSTALKKGDRVLLDVMDAPDEFAVELMRAARRAGATPLIEVRHGRITREVLRGTNEPHAALVRDLELYRMKKVQAYIAIRGSSNASESADVDGKRMALYSRVLRPVMNYRVNKTRWCVLRWPTPSMAQGAGMSTEAFENLYFAVCTMDYRKMARAMAPLARRMKKAGRVQLISPGTDLTFSVKGIGAKMCKGDRNIPDGEVFSCPVKNSVNGHIQFNTPTLYSGTKFENVRLEFLDGKITKATANQSKRLNEILDTDAGARYVGEFSLGFNPYILSPMCDILFDEKISGSLHLTPGQAYEECDNGNRSAVHWDMVLIQRKEWGGGEVWFDGELIRKDGLFLPADLKPLNPANLKS